jgi:hypothetical protein
LWLGTAGGLTYKDGMGDARRKMSRNERMIAAHPSCVYCGGSVAAVQVDHAPPIAVFTLRRRPEGLEFPACAECHAGTRGLDSVAAVYSRLYPDPTTVEGERELVRLVAGMRHNHPDIAAELDANATGPDPKYGHTELARKSLGEGLPLKVFGSAARAKMSAFGARMAMALHYKETGSVLPLAGCVTVRAYTNTALLRGDLKDSFFEALGPFTALVQKGLEAERDFAFAAAQAGDVEGATLIFFRLRLSMGCAAFCFPDATLLETLAPAPAYASFRPGFLKAAT